MKPILLQVFAAARHEILITNSYFVPPPRLAAALTSAARRGVAVELLLPRSSDHRLVDQAAEHIVGELMAAGVRVWHWTGSMIHAKTVVVDRSWSLIGSSNLDAFSLLRNGELNVEAHGACLGEQMAEVFLHDCAGAAALTYVGWQHHSRRRRRLTRLVASARWWM